MTSMHTLNGGGTGGTDPPEDWCLGLPPPPRPTEIWKNYEINE